MTVKLLSPKVVRVLATVVMIACSTGAQAAGGSDVGGSGLGTAFVSNWCRDNVAILSEAAANADMQILGGDQAMAFETLKQGLLKAAQGSIKNGGMNSLTFRAIVRGTELVAALEEATLREDNHMETLVQFLRGYYDFIQKSVREIDLTYFIPYYTKYVGCSSCGSFDIEAFERQFVDYARGELKMVLDLFISKQPNPMGFVVSRWSSKAYLKSLELLALYASRDLQESLWAARFACTTQRLITLNARLANYNSGNRASYMNDAYAVNATYSELKSLIQSLDQPCIR